jgi:guanylate kinase
MYKKWINYWKKSLLDARMADLDIKNMKHFSVEDFDIQANYISCLDKINDLIDTKEHMENQKRSIDKKDERWEKKDNALILISPIQIKHIPERLYHTKDESDILPFWFYAIIDRKGNLSISEETFPIFQRKYLEPLANEEVEFTIGSVDAVDKAATLGTEQIANYSDYILYIKNVFKNVVNCEIDHFAIDGYETITNGIIALVDDNDTKNASAGILNLYENILQKDCLPLLQNLITLHNDEERKPLGVHQLIKSNFLHLGQMGFEYPISISQRKSFYTFLNSNDKVFAVNGPPGTGKTTLLQSVVANMIVQATIQNGNPPIILACSTNNQAITNIVENFSRSNTKAGDLQGRWLPHINGYATYLPATSKTKKELRKMNYQKINNGDGLFQTIENYTCLEKARNFYLEKSRKYFDNDLIDISDTIVKLRDKTITIQNVIEKASLLWTKYLKAEEFFGNIYSNAIDTESYYQNGILNGVLLQNDISTTIELKKQIILYFQKESFLTKILCFFKNRSTLKSRASEINLIFRDFLPQSYNLHSYDKYIILDEIDNRTSELESILRATKDWVEWKTSNAIYGNPPRDENEYWEFEYTKIREKSEPNCFYDELDIGLRHEAFQLSLHYWEGRYLQQLELDLNDSDFLKRGEKPTKNRWLRYAMLTPCFVSTFYMAPKFFTYSRYLQKPQNGNHFDNQPLYDFIDLLIVDEAGQTSPEVGVATFALAKRAIVVGDVKQIEPVWNVASKIDIGNLKKCEIINDYDDDIYEKEFDPKGFLASSGSIMSMAQNASTFKEDSFSTKGVLLIEHRRCYDEIISYCNSLAYNGLLKPLRGKAKSDSLFPPMYHIDVNGHSKKGNSGSRYNEDEVSAIVNWLTTHQESILDYYGAKKIKDLIGIITPFTEQKNRLKQAIKKAGFDDNITIGTVHALQGAERPIVLFSMVYGDGDSGTMFFDRDNKPNMLNVAVSRAKDNFIVFANGKILNKAAKTPSGILANFLK